MADPACHLTVGGLRVDALRVRPVLNVADHASQNVGGLRIGHAINRDDLDPRLCLPHVAGHLPDKLRDLIDNMRRAALTRFQRLRVPLVLNLTATERQIGISHFDVTAIMLIITRILLHSPRVNVIPIRFGHGFSFAGFAADVVQDFI